MYSKNIDPAIVVLNMSSEILESEALGTLLLVAGASALKHVVSAWIAGHSDVLGDPEKVGTVSELWLYPVKSATGISVDSATCTRQGFCQFDVADRCVYYNINVSIEMF